MNRTHLIDLGRISDSMAKLLQSTSSLSERLEKITSALLRMADVRYAVLLKGGARLHRLTK
jgi:hypothetical protein